MGVRTKTCKYNKYVWCPEADRDSEMCYSCGWNPEEDARRKSELGVSQEGREIEILRKENRRLKNENIKLARLCSEAEIRYKIGGAIHLKPGDVKTAYSHELEASLHKNEVNNDKA